MEANKTKWTVDSAHSEVEFKAKHLVISTVTGRFNDYKSEIVSNDENFDGAEANFEANIDSISTNQTDRDNHLKSADFFDAENHPQLIFKDGRLKKISNNSYELNGVMSIKGNEKPISLKAEFGGVADFGGAKKAGFEISGKINRKDFGLTWNALTEAGGMVVSDEIKLNLNLQYAKA